jgi:hypothetical protein
MEKLLLDELYRFNCHRWHLEKTLKEKIQLAESENARIDRAIIEGKIRHHFKEYLIIEVKK